MSEPRRWWISDSTANRIEPLPSIKHLYVEVMAVEDHDRIVAELRSEVAQAKREAADAMSGCCDCPMFKAQGKTVARQAKVIEKLKRYTQHRVECICRAGVLQYSNDCDCGLKAIEQGEGM